ncbi:MAG: hypothetical protein MJK12_06875 [Colwellia sp.]|nr:hypothetical protein [Colwellia sp.]
MKLTSLFIVLTTVLFTEISWANNKELTNTDTTIQVSVDVKIYALKYASEDELSELDFDEIITNNEPEYSQGLTVAAGKTAEATIVYKDKKNDIDSLKVKLSIDKAAKIYAVDLGLYIDGGFFTSKQSSLSRMSDIDVIDDYIFTAKLDDIVKLIKVSIVKITDSSPEMMAKKRLELFRSNLIFKYTQKYFQEDKIWKQDDRRFDSMKKNNPYIGTIGKYYYIANTDNKRLIRGTVSMKASLMLKLSDYTELPTSVQYTGLKNFSLKDDIFNVVVLPNQSVLLGRYDKGVQIEIIDAQFLSTDETKLLKAKYASNN